jgi:hypothetical protein
LEAGGLGEGFAYQYKHYGPYSDDLAVASRAAVVLDLIGETEQPASWGGLYSTYVTRQSIAINASEARRQIAQAAASADAVVLELAATALFLALEGEQQPWDETQRRKPDKAATGRLDSAKQLYERISQLETPRPLPQIR